MKVYISRVDAHVARRLSRLLSQTVVGSRRDEDPDADQTSEDGNNLPARQRVAQSYEIVGTLSPVPTIEEGGWDAASPEAAAVHLWQGVKPKWVKDVVAESDREQIKQHILSSEVIIYDITQNLDEANFALNVLSENTEQFEDQPKTFVAISSVMTWSRTKVDPEDPEAPFTEDEYRRRKPHPNFRDHVAFEKAVIKLGKKGPVRCYVVSAGLVYGGGESIFHFLFKGAWQGDQELLCFGDGSNIVPMIHVDDLSHVVVDIIETLPEIKYQLAVDDSKNSLLEIIQAISSTLGTGRVKTVSKEDALLIKDLPQANYDMLLVNLRLDPGQVKNMTFDWKCESGLVENIGAIVNEYKENRGLFPLKVLLHGPPAVGKTRFAVKLAELYKIHHIQVEEVIKSTISRLEASVARRHVSEAEEQEEEEEQDNGDRELLEELRDAARQNDGRYPDSLVIQFVRDMLRSTPCRNQGYVLDGFPKRTEEAVELFRASKDEETEGDEADGVASVDTSIMPEYVISLEGTDDFIKERIMSLPEAEVVGTKNAEEELKRRLEKFHQISTDENTILNFFDEREVHPLVLRIESNDEAGPLAKIQAHIGKSHNYGPTQEELIAKRIAEEEKKAKESSAAQEEREKREKEENERQAKVHAEWNLRLEEIRKQEQEVLEAQSVPLRNYLMQHVMPTLTKALIEVCNVRPEDPIDFLAEFMFKHNPSNI